ncbi:MAG: methyltransferase family protein, partial [Bacteroidia bacterium]
MDDFIKLLLPICFIIYFGLAFVAKSLLVAKRTRKNPLVLPKDDSAYGLIGRYFEFTLIAMFLYVLIFSFVNELHINYLDINILNSYNFKYAGISLLLFSLGWTILAQYHMRDSWRIGIDNETKTELITSGLFGYSRNPIFFGMVLSLLGLFLL